MGTVNKNQLLLVHPQGNLLPTSFGDCNEYLFIDHLNYMKVLLIGCLDLFDRKTLRNYLLQFISFKLPLHLS